MPICRPSQLNQCPVKLGPAVTVERPAVAHLDDYIEVEIANDELSGIAVAERSDDVLFPLFWNLRDLTHNSRTTIAGPLVNVAIAVVLIVATQTHLSTAHLAAMENTTVSMVDRAG